MRVKGAFLLSSLYAKSAICKCDCIEEFKVVHVTDCLLCNLPLCSSTCNSTSPDNAMTASCLEKSSEKDRIIIVSYLVLTALAVCYALVKDYLPKLLQRLGYHQQEGFEEIPAREALIGTSRDTSRVILDEEPEISWNEPDPINWDDELDRLK